MKKLLSVLLILGVLVACCACTEAKEPNTSGNGDKTELVSFDDINELEPNDKGMYQIHSIEGLKNMANDLDGRFVLLCDIDLGGASWVPVGTQEAPFTGSLNGSNFTISNFVIEQPTADGDMGFFGVSEGNITNLKLADVQVKPTKDTLRVGALVGTNKGNLRRNELYGTLTAAQIGEGASCGGAVGLNQNLLESTTCDIDITYTAEGKANVGGFVGTQDGGKLQFSFAKGTLEVTGGKNKSVGLFAGAATKAEMTTNNFEGEKSKVDGEVYLLCIGQAEETTNLDYLVRDNDRVEWPADVQARRDKVVQEGLAMASVEWTVAEPLFLDFEFCKCCEDKTFEPGKVYRGTPYAHFNNSTSSFMACLDENNVIKDWCYDSQGYDGWAAYAANDCSSAAKQIYATVCNNCNFFGSSNQFPSQGSGTIPVGGWNADVTDAELIIQAGGKGSEIFFINNGTDKILEAYADIQASDLLGNLVAAGGHCQIAIEDAVVMRDETGAIDLEQSYVLTIQQNASLMEFEEEGYYSNWRVNYKLTFQEMLDLWYVPMTFPELVESVEINPVVTVEDTTNGRMGLITGQVVTDSYYIDCVDMAITDEEGKEVFSHRMWATVDYAGDIGGTQGHVSYMKKTFDLARFTQPLRNVPWDTSKSYHCVITVKLTSGDVLVAREFDF